MSAVSASPTDLFGTPQLFVIPRDNDRDMAFDGWLLECAEESKEGPTHHLNAPDESGVKVCVYLTEAESVVTEIVKWSKWEDGRLEERRKVEIHNKYCLDEAVEWLKKDNSGKLGTISKNAWVRACNKYPPMKEQAHEKVN